MMPISDADADATRKTVPIITYFLIALNFFIFFLEIKGGDEFIERWSFIPSRFLANPFREFSTIYTAMFMHAGWAHILGNMLYLWIFGGNVEDRFGRVVFLIFYLLCGTAATIAQLAIDPGSDVPNLGASGAIAGVLGAYILMFPGEKINVIVGYTVMALPALIVIGFWFLLQFLSGIGSLSNTGETGGVAYAAHVGGFLSGLGMAVIFRMFARTKP